MQFCILFLKQYHKQFNVTNVLYNYHFRNQISIRELEQESISYKIRSKDHKI